MLRVALVLLLVAGCAAPGRSAPVRLAYTVTGEGPVVVLLHGHPQTAASWRAVAPALAERHRVVVVDQRGQGDSPAPDGDYDVSSRADDVAALLRELGVTRASVVGTDLGGQVAFALTRDNPGLVERLAVLEAVIPGTAAAAGPLSAPHIARHADVDRMVERTRGREAQHVRDFVCAARNPCPYPPDLIAESAAALRRPGHLRGAFAPYEELTAPSDDPGRVTVPVLAVGGSRGIGGLPAASLREVADDVTEVVLPGATHWLAEEEPAALVAALGPFLAGSR
ncbi:MAG: alpha/beta hydrolase [Actinobacteria bacterium]|nr:alpha/beta hydrolase [Actinomycetota bacterium]MBW3646702.1 alpha/beta hydrolase [Actinomycetota bacterium]